MKSILLSALVFSFSFIAHAGLPVEAAPDQKVLLQSADPHLAQNKKLAYDFFRIILAGRQLDQAKNFLTKDYIQHNPNVPTGLDGFLSVFSTLGGPKPVPDQVDGLVTIQAEGDFVTLSFVNELQDPTDATKTYTTTWFDMFRIQDGKIAEHWDCDVKSK